MKIPSSLKKQIIALSFQIAIGNMSESEAIATALEAIATSLRGSNSAANS